MAETPITHRYVEPTRFEARVFNPSVKWLAEHGVSLLGTRILEVRGRRSGQIRSTVVNLLEMEGDTYLIAPRGTTQWVRNLRAAGSGQLALGKRRQSFTARELGDGEKPPVLREYLMRWGWEVGKFFEGLDKDATDDQLRAIAPDFPAFRITVQD